MVTVNKIPEINNKMARRVVLKHPARLQCELYRKVVNEKRTSNAPGGSSWKVLSSEDATEVDWDYVGEASMLPCNQFESSSMTDIGDATDDATSTPTVLIELLDDSNNRAIKKFDVVYILLAEDVRIAYEVVDIKGVLNIPPYVRRYSLNKRDDLHYVEGFDVLR